MSRLPVWAPWAAVPFVALCAYALGTCESGSDEPTGEVSSDAGDYTCAMHPQIRSAEAGDCPICGMDLVPVASLSEDLGADRVVLSERARTLAKIRTAEVTRLQSAGAGRRLLGRVDYDETTQRTVTTWVGGRIDRLHVAVTGQEVRRGQVVATLYSPEVYAAHQDLLVARRQAGAVGRGTTTVRSAANAALEATRQRLRLLGVPDREVERMGSAERPWTRIPIRSPFAGTVIERAASEGAYVQTGAPLYRIADLSRLWVQLDAYESDLPSLSVGVSVEITLEGVRDPIEGRIAFIDPIVDVVTRTARVRVEVEDAEQRLRPGMFADAVVLAEQDPAVAAAEAPLVVPHTAPLFTGRRSVVYVEVPDTDRPTYEARRVRLGPRTADHYPVLSGLRAGERVVVNGAFSLDADLQIRGGDSMMAGGDDARAMDELPAPFAASLARVLRAYLTLQSSLADDDLAGARAAAEPLPGAVTAVRATGPERAVAAWTRASGPAGRAAEAIVAADDLETARQSFRTLSDALIEAVRVLGNPLASPLRIAHCPMADDNRGAEWLQQGEVVDNSYFGSAMLSCGEVRETLEGSGSASASAEPAPTPTQQTSMRSPPSMRRAPTQMTQMTQMTPPTPMTAAPMVDHSMHEPSAQWTCRMHPEVVRSRAGDCPICGMALVRRGGR